MIVGRLRRDTWLGLRWRLLFDRACDFVSNCDLGDKMCTALQLHSHYQPTWSLWEKEHKAHHHGGNSALDKSW